MGEKFLKYLIIKVFALYWAWDGSEKKSQYPADGAEYCDFTFLLYGGSRWLSIITDK